MTLHFPNPSRSFDEKNNCILFWGYDQTFEVSFFLKTDALKRFNQTKISTEIELLKTFDSAWDKICEVADKVYTRSGPRTYAHVLTDRDF